MEPSAEALLHFLGGLDGVLGVVVVAGARAGGLLLGLPHTAASVVPRQVKAVVVLALSVGLAAAQPPASLAPFGGAPPVAIAVAALREFLVGLSVGFVVQLALAAARIGGEIVGIDMGLSFSAVADPTGGGQTTAASALYYQFALQLFLALRLDHAVLYALAAGARSTPLGGARASPDTWIDLVRLGSTMFEAGLRLALPLSAALFTLKVAMAMLARVAPKLQIFTLAFALAILTGLFVLRGALPGIADAVAYELQRFADMSARVATSP